VLRDQRGGGTRRRDEVIPAKVSRNLNCRLADNTRPVSRTGRYNFGVTAISDNIDKFSGYRYTSDRFITLHGKVHKRGRKCIARPLQK